MQKATIRYGFSVFTVMTFILSGCALNKMNDKAGDIQHTVTPTPLEVKGDSVSIAIDVKFPGDYFHPKVKATAQPVLVYDNDSTTFQPVTFVGEDVEAEGVQVPEEKGKTYTYESTIPYKPAMKNAELKVHLSGSKGDNSQKFKTFSVAKGVITTPYLMQDDEKLMWGKAQFERTSMRKHFSKIHYEISRSYVRKVELRDKDIKMLDSLANMIAKNDDLSLDKMNIEGYASPDGSIDFNQELAQARSNSAMKAVLRDIFESHGLTVDTSVFFLKRPKGEDWHGFKNHVKESDLEEKQKIIDYLRNTDDPATLEEKIRNLSQTFDKLKKEVLPDLRRSEMTLRFTETGKSNEELKALAKTNPDSLLLEEQLKAASLLDNHSEQLGVYQAAVEQYPEDWRAYNNMGVIYLKQGNNEQAMKNLNKATNVGESSIPYNNLGVLEYRKGNRQKAMKYYEKAEGLSSQLAYNKGLIQISNGDYEKAASNTAQLNTINTALAHLLNEEYNKAKQAINKAEDGNSALGHYVKAIIGARTENRQMVFDNLEEAVQKDESYREKAKNDLEFRDYFDNDAFQRAIGD